MKSNHSTLQELISEMQTMQASQEEETTRLRRRLAWLEGRRREFFDAVALNSGDFDTRRKLEETERQMEEIQATLAHVESDLRASLPEIRQRIIELRNEELTRLEEESKALRVHKQEIHGELLPEASARVASLHEEEDRLAQRGEEIARRIRDLDQLELPNTQVS